MSQYAAKDAALRAVGRTVVSFQRLEHNLKLAARPGPIEGTLAKIQHDVERRAQRAQRLTLGQAIQAWLTATSGESPTTVYTPDLFDATLRMTISLGDADTQQAHAVALESLLAARNNLIHGGLVQFPWDSPDECERLVRELDELNERIRVQLDFVAAFLRAFSELPQDLERAFGLRNGQDAKP